MFLNRLCAEHIYALSMYSRNTDQSVSESARSIPTPALSGSGSMVSEINYSVSAGTTQPPKR